MEKIECRNKRRFTYLKELIVSTHLPPEQKDIPDSPLPSSTESHDEPDSRGDAPNPTLLLPDGTEDLMDNSINEEAIADNNAYVNNNLPVNPPISNDAANPNPPSTNDNCKIPLNVVMSPFFQDMLDGVAGIRPGYKGPSYDKLRVHLLADLKRECQMLVDSYRSAWKETGCLCFVKSIDVSSIIKNASHLCSLFPEVIEWIGPNDIMHVVTNNVANYVATGMLRSEDAIKEMFRQNKTAYQPYTDIINSRWDKHLMKDLHAAAYFLNRSFFFNKNYKEAPDVMRGLLDLVTLYCKCNNLDSFETMKEIHLYRDRKESFDKPEPIRAVSKLKPDEWWRLFGSSTPCLQKIAVRILSQASAASSGCERNWSLFYQIHNKRRNRLEHDRLNDIVYVTYNLHLKSNEIDDYLYQSDGGNSDLYATSLDSSTQEGGNEGEDDLSETDL
ncbi:uncharacterized protein [Arachis hypogaea]|uniref:uncharacterized protein n=1 Tax=Arachis hypogaea TaxID=3818 RepID=UPI003B20DC5B